MCVPFRVAALRKVSPSLMSHKTDKPRPLLSGIIEQKLSLRLETVLVYSKFSAWIVIEVTTYKDRMRQSCSDTLLLTLKCQRKIIFYESPYICFLYFAPFPFFSSGNLEGCSLSGGDTIFCAVHLRSPSQHVSRYITARLHTRSRLCYACREMVNVWRKCLLNRCMNIQSGASGLHETPFESVVFGFLIFLYLL